MDPRPFAAILLAILLTSSAVAGPEAKPKDQNSSSSSPELVPPPNSNGNLNSSQKASNQSSSGSGKAPPVPGSRETPPPPLTTPVTSPPPPLLSPNSSGSPPPPASVAGASNRTSLPGGAGPSGSGNGSGNNISRSEGDGKRDGKKGGGGPAALNGTGVIPKCGADAVTCWGSLVACLWHPKNDSKWFLVLQNEGENALTITALLLPSTKIGDKTLAKNTYAKMEIPADASKFFEITLIAGKEKCTLPRRTPIPVPVPVPVPNFFQQLPSYAPQMTPIYGAYAIFLTALIGGGAWACCRFGRRGRRVDAGLPYQQLEMGIQPHSTSVVQTDTADGWDQGWDDDWDEEEAGPPQRQHVGGDSANGHTLQTSKKDGWEDWDD